jgi:hypothetical protein
MGIRIITLLRRETFDYTEWQRTLFKNVPLNKFLQDAKTFRENEQRSL